MSQLMTGHDDAASDRLTFDSSLHPAEAFERYRDLYSIGADVLQTGPCFNAQVAAWRLDRMLLYDRRLNDVGHRRDARRTQTDGFDHFTATLLLEGELEMAETGGTARRLSAGEVLLVDTHVPASNRMRHARVVTLAIARERMAAMSGDVASLHGLMMTADEARLFREFVESLLRNLPTMNRAGTMAAAGVLTTLLMMAIDNSGVGRPNAGLSRDVERLARFKRLVDARLADPDFGMTEAIRESALSRATLYRLLAAEGGIATLIRNRRLETIRARLSDPTETRTFSELVDAAGLTSFSHASHAFLQRYDIRPSDYRDIVNVRTGADAFLKMRFWQDEVR